MDSYPSRLIRYALSMSSHALHKKNAHPSTLYLMVGRLNSSIARMNASCDLESKRSQSCCCSGVKDGLSAVISLPLQRF